MKHIIFGGFDYAVLYEMDQNAILDGIDYFVDVDKSLIGQKYLGKPIDRKSTRLNSSHIL